MFIHSVDSSWIDHCIYRGVAGYIFQINIVFLSWKIVFVLANSVGSDEMPHSVSHIAAFRGVAYLKFNVRG